MIVFFKPEYISAILARNTALVSYIKLNEFLFIVTVK